MICQFTWVVATSTPGFANQDDIWVDCLRCSSDGIYGLQINHGSQIKTKAIDVILIHPMQETFDDHFPRHGILGFKIISTATM